MQIKETSRSSKRPKLPPEKYQELVKKLRAEHEKPVKGMFEFLDAQGGWLDFVYRYFKDDPIYTIRLTHGEICELPMGIVKHLNNTKKKIRTFGTKEYDAQTRGVPKTYEVQSRIRFTPMDVM
jgi:hypothetical protein